ncbi:hypothetical protein CY0110_08321 [Crocosphaera chwakensis CCY0110]|uniref:Uncharacterized protein n=1 Tax=Crocosphaera chwakensis CCY0110 TaxID=391612 RepID=A3ISE9_9CHRO|nr:hypothetical protein CY0110_08321 [Crocosphaera chwakensis CCY0110]
MANPTSWVTHTIVIPPSAKLRIVSKTSLIISGSRAEVGSSNNIIFGSMANARAIATRCCCPPDNWPGYLLACSKIPTFSNSCMALASAFCFFQCRTQIGAKVTLFKTVKWGNKLNCWNTIPTSLLMASIFLRS